jgi:small nuclear ribonucleoprotein (snRNP)-like protein
MDLNKYLGLKVKILLKNNYYYVGVVLNADESSLDLKDVKGQNVSLNKDIILSIQEVSSNGY